jgi:hypothetical protein
VQVNLLSKTSRQALGLIQTLIQWVPERVFQRIKRPGREVHHSLSFGAEVENEWSYTSSPTIRLHGVDRYFTSLGPNIEK